MGDLDIQRRDALWRQTSYFCWREFEQEPNKPAIAQILHYEHILETVEHYRRQAAYTQPATLQLLRDIEAGAVLYDPDDTMRHTFTCIGDGDRVHLRDSGLSLLFAIDCDYEQLKAEIEPIINQIKREALGNFRAAQERDAETYRRWNRETKTRKKAKCEPPAQMRLLELEPTQP